MGTDIHPVVQVFEGDRWQTISLESGPVDPRGFPLICHRNYDVFAILADVRNGVGFGGAGMSSRFEPISAPRGFPPDFAADSADLGDHSFSWVTVQELNRYPWNQEVTRVGIISKAEYVVWDKRTRPSSYCKSIGGHGIITLTEEEFGHVQSLRTNLRVYVAVSWKETCASCAESFFTEVFPWLRTLSEPDWVRIVFGFDS